MELLQPYPLGPLPSRRPTAGAAVRQRGETRLPGPEIGCGCAARSSGGDGGLQQTLVGQAPRVVAGGVLLRQSRESKWTRERVQAEGTVGAHTEKCGWGHCARTMWLQEYFLGALRSRRQNRALLKVVLVLLGAAAVQGVGALRWKRFSARGKGARAVCGRHAKLGSVAAKCSRHDGRAGPREERRECARVLSG